MAVLTSISRGRLRLFFQEKYHSFSCFLVITNFYFYSCCLVAKMQSHLYDNRCYRNKNQVNKYLLYLHLHLRWFHLGSFVCKHNPTKMTFYSMYYPLEREVS